jgi:hypothetical protein
MRAARRLGLYNNPIPIDIGPGATTRASAVSAGGNTIIDLNNPANANGVITSVEFYASSADLANCEVATFYLVSSGVYSTRDNEAIGTVTKGSKQTFSVNLTVQTGDFLGFYCSTGSIYRDTDGYSGFLSKAGDNIPASSVGTWTTISGDAVSIYGTGLG